MSTLPPEGDAPVPPAEVPPAPPDKAPWSEAQPAPRNKVMWILGALMGNAFFWILAVLGFMVFFIMKYERPVNFTVQQQYQIF